MTNFAPIDLSQPVGYAASRRTDRLRGDSGQTQGRSRLAVARRRTAKIADRLTLEWNR